MEKPDNEKIFSAYLKNIFCVGACQLYKDIHPSLEENGIVKQSNIYFIAKLKKSTFDLQKAELDKKFNLKVPIKTPSLDDYEIDLPVPLFLFDNIQVFQETYSSSNDLEKCLYNTRAGYWTQDDDEKMRKGKIRVELDLDESNEEIITLVIVMAGFEKPWPIKISVPSIDVEIDNYPNILYIGQSFDLLKRLHKHEKIQEASISQCSSDEEIFIYFLEFDVSKVSLHRFKKNVLSLENWNVDDVKKKKEISLIEMTLINHFKPILNEQHKKSNLKKNSIVKDQLKSNNYDEIILEIILEKSNRIFKFWTDTVDLTDSCTIRCSI